MNMKAKKRIRSTILFLLCGVLVFIDNIQDGDLIKIVIWGGLLSVLMIMLGHITNFLLSKIGVHLFNHSPMKADDIIDHMEPEISELDKKNIDDINALNYGILWVIIFIIRGLI